MTLSSLPPYRQSLPQFSSVTSSSTSPQMLTEEKIRATSTARQHRRAKLAMHFCWLWEIIQKRRQIQHVDHITIKKTEYGRKRRSMLRVRSKRQLHGSQFGPQSRGPEVERSLAARELIHILSSAISNITVSQVIPG